MSEPEHEPEPEPEPEPEHEPEPEREHGPLTPTGDTPPGFDLAGYLIERGADPAVVAAAQAKGRDELRRLAAAVVLLGEPPSLRPVDVWRGEDDQEQLGRSLWRAMGFANLPDDMVALTSADVDALAAITQFLDASGVSTGVVERFTRLLGQSMSRVADALLSIADQGISEWEGLPDVDTDDLRILTTELVNPLIEQELSYLLRRHLYAGSIRRISGEGDHVTGEVVAVGFADVVSFTRLSGQLPEEDLAELLEQFESTTSDEIAEHGGRVVKLIGDAVLFAFTDAASAAACAMHLVERFGGDQPELRVGLAYGSTISRLGDLFGPTVNLASRLVGFARPGTVLVDRAFAEALGGHGDLQARPLRPRELKGIGTTRVHVLRRVESD